MILLGYDVESTGLNKHEDRIIEIGLVLYSTGQNKVLESTGFLVESDGVPISEEITKLTGVTQEAVNRFGYETISALQTVESFMGQADAIIAHNGNRFDRPFTENSFKRHIDTWALPDKLWIDTMIDIPSVKGEQLITMCAKMGFMYNAHSAEDDAKAVLELARRHASQSPEKSFEKIAERAKSPIILIQSHQGRNNNSDAKKFQFRWNPDHKIWWKPVKEMDYQQLVKDVPFDVSRLGKEVTFEQLDS